MAAEWWEYLVPILFILVGYLIAKVIMYIVRKLEQASSKTQTTLDDRIIENLDRPLKLIFVLVGFYFAVKEVFVLQPDLSSRMIYGMTVLEASDIMFLVLTAFVIAYSMTKVIKAAFAWYLSDILKGSQKRRKTVFKFSQNIIFLVIYVIAALIVLSMLNIDIQPMLAGLGIGGLAVALAAQDTLSNFFSGFYLAADQPIRVGDYIKISDEQRGYVEEVGWRNTKIRTIDNNLMIIPNTKLADSVIINYEHPKPELVFWVPLGVAYNSNLDKVEKVTLKVAKEVMEKVEGGSPGFEPYMRYSEFGDSAISFSVGLAGKARGNKFVLRHEFIKRLKKEYDKEGIGIPFPQRDVHMKKD